MKTLFHTLIIAEAYTCRTLILGTPITKKQIQDYKTHVSPAPTLQQVIQRQRSPIVAKKAECKPGLANEEWHSIR